MNEQTKDHRKLQQMNEINNNQLLSNERMNCFANLIITIL